jgi:SAM-dependent methyltransferase
MIPAAPPSADPSYYEGQDLEALADIPAYYNWILDRFRPHLHGSVIEVGAGLGNISALYADSVRRLLLLEPAQNLHGRLEERFAGRSHVSSTCALLGEVHAAEAQAPGSRGGPFDAALLVNVLEHVEDDRGMLAGLFDLLAPNGALLVFVPALPWLYGALDARVHHVRRYTKAGLTEAIQSVGFEIESISYFDISGVLPWFVLGRVLRQSGQSARAAKIYDRVVVPVARPLERLVQPPIGKNLICVARRCGSTVSQ